jgi:RimJ/RimL family protein N-acetyltransferase
LEHNLSMRGHAYGLRPVALADAEYIFGLRSASGRFLNRGASSEREQRTWLENYFLRPDDYYFVIEHSSDGRAEGLVGIYDVNRETRTAEWGRFVLRPGSCAAVETALLVYRCAFDVLGLVRVYCRTLADNAQVVAFHDSCGLERAPEVVMVAHDGRRREAVEHLLDRAGWPNVRERLDRLAARLAARTQTSAIAGS